MLYKVEAGGILKLSHLDQTSLSPSPIERQKVSTCLKVFCEGTAAALKTLPQLDHNAFSGTANLIKIFARLRKILNVNSSGLNDIDADPSPAALNQ